MRPNGNVNRKIMFYCPIVMISVCIVSDGIQYSVMVIVTATVIATVIATVTVTVTATVSSPSTLLHEQLSIGNL